MSALEAKLVEIMDKPEISTLAQDVDSMLNQLEKEGNKGKLKQHAEKFHSYMRMNLSEFNNLLAVVTPWLTRRSIRTPINPEEKIDVNTCFLATGEAFRSLSFQFRLGVSTVSKIVASTCSAIFNALKTDYLQVPATEEEWIDIAAKFFSRWNCPNTLGAIDGKHVLIKRPPHSGSLYYNYKGRLAQYFLLFVMLTTGVSMLATVTTAIKGMRV
uniref:DDE Tnp4 domain-containing protein n=1 Tax=Ditylenchus dipsaci TaxID=166011 RepID=A0A915CXC5_9BILA